LRDQKGLAFESNILALLAKLVADEQDK